MGPGRSFPTNLDLANILGMTEFDFEKFHFSDFCRSEFSQISKFLGRASSILLQYFFCHRYLDPGASGEGSSWDVTIRPPPSASGNLKSETLNKL